MNWILDEIRVIYCIDFSLYKHIINNTLLFVDSNDNYTTF